ncbi:MAG: porin [Candidatus Nitrotoga sp.]
MKKLNQYAYFVWIATLNMLLGISHLPLADAAPLDEKDKKIEVLEQRLLLLKQRLDVQAVFISPRKQSIEEIDQKIKILERHNEIVQEEAEEKTKTSPKFDVSPKGVSFTSADGDNSVRLRASIQGDGRFFINDNRNLKGVNEGFLTNRFELKQARIWLEGRFGSYNDFKLMPDFGANGAILADAYIDLHYFPFASLSIGKQKTPISLERLQGDSDGTFLERAYPAYLSSNRDIGVKLHGSFAAPGDKYAYASPIDFKNFLTYEVGIFNGGGDNGANDADKENEDNKELAGRLWLHPFKNKGIAALEGLGVGIAGSWETPKKNAMTVKALNSALGQNTVVDYTKVASTAVAVQANGEHYRIYPQAYWYYGPYGLLGEYVLSSQKLTGDGGKTAIQQSNTAWQIQASYVFTGEDNTFQGIKPQTSFDPLNGTWGALQIAGRWSELSIDKETFKLLDPQASIAGARSWTVGANWFPNQNVRLMADYEHTYFSGGAVSGNRPTEEAFATRLQLVF